MTENPALPRPLIFWTSVSCAVLLMLAVQPLLSARGLQFVEVWRDYAASTPLRLRAAMVWWIIAGLAFVCGATVAAVLGALPPPWHRYRKLRWVAGAAIVFAFAHVANGGPQRNDAAIGMDVASALAATGLAILAAMLGSFFALRR